jgi:hypothetical protein
MENIDSLREKVDEETDLIFFDEIKNCIESKAYRSAYIMTWISIAESLRFKIKEMSYRDNDVKEMIKLLDKHENDGFSIDHELLEDSKKLGYIDKDEYEKLNTIRKMRNSYAHPSGKAPDYQEVFCSLTNAVKLVLSKPPLLRHGYVQNTLDKIFSDPHYFVDDSVIILKIHAESFVKRIHPEVLNYSLENLLKRFDGVFDEYENKVFRQRGIIFGHEIIKTIIKNSLQNNNDFNEYLDKHQISISLIYLDKNIWIDLHLQEKNRSFGYITDQINTKKLVWCRNYILNKLYILYKTSLLTSKQKNTFNSLLDSFSYKSLISLDPSEYVLEIYIRRVIEDLKTYNWDYQNDAADALFDLNMDNLSSIDIKLQEELGRNVLQAAEGNSWRSKDFINYISNKNYPLKFIYGLFAETLVNEDEKFRLKSKFFKKIVFIALKHSQNDIIFQDLFKEINNSIPKNKEDNESYQNSLIYLKEMKNSQISLFNKSKNEQLINNLIEAIKVVKDKYFE